MLITAGPSELPGWQEQVRQHPSRYHIAYKAVLPPAFASALLPEKIESHWHPCHYRGCGAHLSVHFHGL